MATTAITGTLVQTSTGRLVVDTNHSTGEADRLDVQGAVRLAGAVEVHPVAITNRAVTVLTASGGLTLDPALTSSGTQLFRFDTQQSGNALVVQPRAEFAGQASNLGTNQRGVAIHLQQVWDSGASLGNSGFDALSGISSPGGYHAALSSLAGASVGGVAASKLAASERFADNLTNCDPYRRSDTLPVEESCLWIRSGGTFTNLASSSDDAGYRQSAVTTQLGGQKEVAPGWFIGASAGYEASWLRGDDDGSRVSGTSALFGLMVKRQSGPWLLSGVADGGYGWYRSSRQIQVGSALGHANGSPTVAHAGLHLRAAYEVPLGTWYVKPSLEGGAVYRGMPGYDEAGSTPFNLAVRSSSDVVGSVSPMMEVGRGGVLPDGTSTLRGFLGLGAAFYVNNDWTGRAQFLAASAGTDPFTATSKLPGAVGKLSAGLNLFTARGIEGKVSYDTSLAPGYSSQSVVGRLAWVF